MKGVWAKAREFSGRIGRAYRTVADVVEPATNFNFAVSRRSRMLGCVLMCSICASTFNLIIFWSCSSSATSPKTA